MLRNARERKGLDLSTAARKLRIRPDILRAIEDGDFARMPPRGYTSNMVGAYARLVGLNPSEVTRAYRDEAYQFETGRRPYDRPDRSHSSERSYDRSGSRSGSSRSGRRTETLEMPSNRSNRSRSYDSTGGRSSRGAAPQPQYTRLVRGRLAPGSAASFGSVVRLIIGGAIIVGLLVLVIVLAFGNRGGEAEDTPTIPISGMANSASTTSGSGDASNTATPSVEPVAPTSAKFTWEVLDGKEAYIEIYKDDKTIMAETVTGPDTGDEDVTDTLRFVTTSPDNVKISVDGEEVKLTSPNENGVYSYTVNFEDVLEQWRKDNGVSSAKDDTTKDSDAADDDSSGDAAGQSDEGDDSSTAGSGDSTDTSSSDSGDASDSDGTDSAASDNA